MIEEKGTLGAIFNAANEEAVRAFLNHQIPFLAIEQIINDCLKKEPNIKSPDYETLKQVDLKTRSLVKEMIMKGEY